MKKANLFVRNSTYKCFWEAVAYAEKMEDPPGSCIPKT